jgi:hypothetical protein
MGRWPKATDHTSPPRPLGPLSDGQLLAALAAARGQDGAAGPGTHPLTETVDLRPPTVIRLERTLAHWDSWSTSMKGGHVMRRAARLRPGIGTATIANATWVSLLTVRVIDAQVKPGRFRMVKHHDFHNVPTADDLGCGKSMFAGRLPGGWLPPRGGETHCSLRTHLVDEPVDNELRLVIDAVEPIVARAITRGEGSHR